MKPIKKREIVNIVASELSINEQLVFDIISEYYSYVQKQMSSGDHLYISVPRLGVFRAIKKRLINRINKNKEIIVNIDKEGHSFKKYEKIQQYKLDIGILNNLLSKFDAEREKRELVTQRKVKYYNDED